MHPCFSVDEVLRFLACKFVASGANAGAVSLTCCCKSFEDPMLDAPRETQNRLTSLVKSFALEVWKEEGGSLVSPSRIFVLSPPNRSI